MGIESHRIVSIGGGINLRPAEFKRISHNRNSPKILEVERIKRNMAKEGTIARNGNWVSSVSSGKKGFQINRFVEESWEFNKTIHDLTEYTYRSSNGSLKKTSIDNKHENWIILTELMGCLQEIIFTKSSNQIKSEHSCLGMSYTGIISSNGRDIVFSK